MLKINPSKKFLDKVVQCYTLGELSSISKKEKEVVSRISISNMIKRGELPFSVYTHIKEPILKILKEEQNVG